MKKIITIIIGLFIATVASAGFWTYSDNEPLVIEGDLSGFEQNLGTALRVTRIPAGGTGTSTKPTNYGDMFVWNGSVWSYMATSTLGISGGTGATVLNDLTDVTLTSTTTNDILQITGTGNFVNTSFGNPFWTYFNAADSRRSE